MCGEGAKAAKESREGAACDVGGWVRESVSDDGEEREKVGGRGRVGRRYVDNQGQTCIATHSSTYGGGGDDILNRWAQKSRLELSIHTILCRRTTSYSMLEVHALDDLPLCAFAGLFFSLRNMSHSRIESASLEHDVNQPEHLYRQEFPSTRSTRQHQKTRSL